MAVHRARLDSISNVFVNKDFKKIPRKTDFGSKFIFAESNEGNIGILLIFFL